MVELEQAQSYLKRASHKLEEARIQLQQKYQYPESVSASQECIEFSIKGVYLILGEKFSKDHELKEDEFFKLYDKIPQELQLYNFPRLYLLSKFWSSFYIVTKYGLEKFGLGPEKLIKDKEADIALKHAEECYLASNVLLQYQLRRQRVI